MTSGEIGTWAGVFIAFIMLVLMQYRRGGKVTVLFEPDEDLSADFAPINVIGPDGNEVCLTTSDTQRHRVRLPLRWTGQRCILEERSGRRHGFDLVPSSGTHLCLIRLCH